MMKKSILFAALAAAVAMPSCSSDEAQAVNEGAGIKFSVSAGKQSRAIAVDNNSINKFHVWAVAANNPGAFFMNTDVTKDGGNWTYSPTKFWPQANIVNFFAISAGTSAGCNLTDITGAVSFSESEGKKVGMVLNNYTVVDKANLDVLYAACYGASKKTGTVALNFRHALSQLAFAAKCTNSDLTIRVKSIRVENIANKGTLAGPKATTQNQLLAGNTTTETGDNWGKWSGQTGSATYTAPFNADFNVPLNSTATEYSKNGDKYDGLLVLPQTITAWDMQSFGSSLKGSRFLIECQILSGTEQTQIWPSTGEYAEVAIPVPAHTWQQGMRYLYTFVFNTGAGYTPGPGPDPEDPENPGGPEPVLKDIKISVTVDEFQNGGNTDVNM